MTANTVSNVKCPLLPCSAESVGGWDMAALTLDGVSKRYGEFQAVRDLSFQVEKGAICGFLGPNGAGKTSTLRMILGLQPATSGTDRDPGRRRRAQGPRPDRLPARGARPLQEDDAGRRHRLLRLAEGPADRARAASGARARCWRPRAWARRSNKKMKELSKGMAQKVQLIASVVHRPEFVILDEPFTGSTRSISRGWRR